MKSNGDSIEGIEDHYPLSPLQEGMLFHSLLAPGTGIDIQHVVLHLREELSLQAFREAWRRLIARHAILRTSFQWKEMTRPRQVVHQEVVLPWVEEDWGGLHAEEIDARMQKHLLAEFSAGFDMSQSPLFRLAIFKVNACEYYCCWTIHHAVVDGRSYPILIKELFGLYQAIRDGRDYPLEPPRPYRGYIAWLEQRKSGDAEIFWRDFLKGFKAPTPIVRASEAAQPRAASPRYGELEIVLSEEMSSSLQHFSERERLSLSTLAHGAWAILLGRYSGEEDVLFGVVRACRYGTVERADGIAGPFLNTLPMRVGISPSQPLREWLSGVRRIQDSVRDHEHTSLSSVQKWSEVPRGQSLFESLLMFENYSINSVLRKQGGEWLNREFALHGKTMYPLMLSVYAGKEIRLCMRYHLERFREDEIRRMLGHFETILEGMAANPGASSCSLPIITSTERATLVEKWNRTAMPYPAGETLHGLFENQVAATPGAVAVECRGSQLTYRELNVFANLVAARLSGLGVKPGVCVGIFVERSVEMVAGLLGILKAGGAYVPMDPSYPSERLGYMIEDAGIPVLVTQKDLLSALPPHHAQTVCLEDVAPERQGRASGEPGNIAGAATADDLAYVIFTSGSTGRPKGVEIRHKSVVNFLTSMRQRPGISADDVLLSVTTLSFDIAGLELYLPLVTGARVVIASRVTAADGHALAGEIHDRNATYMQATPATWRLLLESGWKGKPGFTMLCGGEALPVELAEALVNTGGTLWNMYGPTETTIWSTVEEITPDGKPPVIGRPIGNTSIYIVDRYGHLAPVGVPGELLIGGTGLARGYVGRPDLTAEKFVRDEFSHVPGAILYRTGDLARYRDDGTIECLGRLDFQVKVRGFRIELAEVESVLSTIAGVKECAVTARQDGNGENRLVGYVVADHDAAASTGEMRRQMRTRLPEYMVPSVIMLIDALPLTPNGKIDRKALPAPDTTRPDSENAYVPPRTSLEKQLTKLWEEIFNVRPIGIRDNFFDLGGHSLLAFRLFSHVEKLIGKDLPLVTLFEAPTIEQLAAVFADKGWAPR